MCVFCDVFTLSDRNICKIFCKISHASIQTPTDIRSAGVLIFLHKFFLVCVFVLFCSLSRTSYSNLYHFLCLWNCFVKTRTPTNDANSRSMRLFGILFHWIIRMNALWWLNWLIWICSLEFRRKDEEQTNPQKNWRPIIAINDYQFVSANSANEAAISQSMVGGLTYSSVPNTFYCI